MSTPAPRFREVGYQITRERTDAARANPSPREHVPANPKR